jgi:hypothetical protein
MKPIAHIILLAAMSFVAPHSWAQEAEAPVCGGEIQQALAAALRYGLGDVPEDYAPQRIDLESPVVPDYAVLRKDDTIYVRNYLDMLGCSVDRSVLPASGRVRFALIDDDQLLDLARRDGDHVAFVRALGVEIGEFEAVVQLGVALRAAPQEEPRYLTCCCAGEMVLRRSGNQWVFENWRNVYCA